MYQIIIRNPVTKTSYHVSPLNALNFATKAKVYHLKSHKSYDPFIVTKKSDAWPQPPNNKFTLFDRSTGTSKNNVCWVSIVNFVHICFSLGFTPHKAEQLSQDKELEEREYNEEKHAG